ncbi:hypothetical protein H0E87_014487 [Populus deltoides]|uniref:Uncharacterized protein n=1 Tax=Populus deltoides TaxID=3696 RepID=A0A8T2YDF9_POPDE|nr:hypothetical protein H0E87_014487 [Populus deltoides]
MKCNEQRGVVIELELGGWLHARYTSLHSFVSVGDLLAGALQIVMCNATNVSVKDRSCKKIHQVQVTTGANEKARPRIRWTLISQGQGIYHSALAGRNDNGRV